jgi:CRP-like cAMP-binding protein
MARDRRRPRRANLSELIAAKEYAQAIAVLREQVRVHEQLSQRPPSIQRRLQLADLLLLSGRREEALPIFDALAVELMKDGFAAKAVAILKRIDRLDPGRADVETRLAQLANRPVRTAAPPEVTELPAVLTEPPATESTLATIGPEEHPPAGPAEEPPVESVSAAPEVQTPAQTVEAEAALPTPAGAETPEATPNREGTGFTSMLKRLFTMLPRKSEEEAKPPAAAVDAAPGIAEAKTLEQVDPATMEESAAEGEPKPALAATPETETVAAPDTAGPREAIAELEPSAEEAPTDAASPEVVEKLGGVFKKFLAALPGASEDDDLDSEVAAREFVDALAASGLDQDDDDGEFIAAFIDDDGEATPPAESIAEAASDDLPEVLLEADPDPAPIARPRPAASARSTSGTPITEAAFRDQVFDLLEQVLRQPDEPSDPLPPPAETTEPLAASYRDTLLLHPLFSDLSPSEMLAMLRALSLVFMAPGDIIVTEGEPGASLFLIISGDVLLFVRNPEGRNIEVGRLSEGAFFGEMSVLSGKPRNATITAGSRVEMLELPKALLDGIAQAHPRVRDIVDALYLQRANSAEVAAVRSVATGDTDDARERAREVLRTYFGGRRFEPRMQLKLATVLLKAGKQDEAVPVLVTLANELLREGDTAKAIAILKKVEVIRTRSLEVMNLAPLVREGAERGHTSAPRRTPPPEPDAAGARTEAFFAQWLTDTARRADTNASPIAARRIPGYAPELLANPLFEGFTEGELLAFIQGLRLLVFEPGDIILTEGESGESVFILAGGAVKVSVRDPSSRSVPLCELQEGAFFGEISALSGRLRSATVTAASHCELLELDRAALDTIAATHPRIRQILEEASIERAASPEAARIRTAGRVQPEA